MRAFRAVSAWGLFAALLSGTASASDLGPLLESLRAVGPKGAGHAQAAAAWQQLVQADAAALPEMLAALDGAGPLAANWIRAAVDTVAQRQLQQGGRLPQEDLDAFVRDTRHAPRARRLAYEWLCRVDPSASQRLIPGMLDDPSLELRRDAVAMRIAEAEALEKGNQTHEAAAAYRRALTSARDQDQVKLLAGRLEKLGEKVDLARHFGFLVRWRVIGPLDNTDGKGFATAYAPEKERFDPEATCPGKHGPVRWIDHVTGDADGWIDLNKALAEEKLVAAYAMAEFHTSHQQEVDLRLSSYNAL